MFSLSSKKGASTTASSVLVLLALASSAFAAGSLAIRQSNGTDSSNPDVDPADDIHNPLRYIASNTDSIIALALVVATALIEWPQYFKFGGSCMLSMLIGEWTYAAGFAVRIVLHKNPDSRGVYIAFTLLNVLSPCAFIASAYMLLGRLARYLNAQGLLFIRPTRITAIFVTSDVTTIFIQAIGASMTISTKHKTEETGQHILQAGLIIQLISFVFFCFLYLRFLFLASRRPELWLKDANLPFSKDWRLIAIALFISCGGIVVRSTYRVIELAEGAHGALAKDEGLFYLLDTLPLWIAISIYAFLWPTRIARGLEKSLESGTNATIVSVEAPKREK